MRHLVLSPLMCLTLMWTSFSGTAVQAADPATLIPGDAAAVVRLKAPESTVAKVVSMVNVVQPGFGGLVEAQAGMIGAGIMNPALAGVDQSRDWWVAVFVEKGKEAEVVFVVPATDIEQMQGALGEDLFFESTEDWAIYGEDEAVVKAVATHDGPTFKDVLRKRSQTVFDSGDMSVMVNVKALTSTFRAEIAQVKKEAQSEIENAPNDIPEIPGMNLDWIADLVPKILEGMFDVVDETEQVVETVIISNEGIKVDSTIDFTAGGKVAGFLANSGPKTLDSLNKLPADHVGYFAFGGDDSNSLQDFGFEILKKIVTDSDKQAQIQEILDLSKEIEVSQAAASFGLGDLTTGLIRSVAIYNATPVETVKKVARKSSVFANLVEVPGVRQSITIQEDAETYGSRTADVMIMEQTFEGENAELGGLQQQIMTFMYGPEGIVTRMGYLKEGYIQSMGGGTEGMKAAFEAYDSSANADNGAFRRDRSQLLEKANFVGLLDVPTLLADAAKIAAASGMSPIPISPEDIDGIGIEKSYLGFSAAGSEDGLQFNTFIPVQTVQNGVKIFMYVQSMQAQGQAF